MWTTVCSGLSVRSWMTTSQAGPNWTARPWAICRRRERRSSLSMGKGAPFLEIGAGKREKSRPACLFLPSYHSRRRNQGENKLHARSAAPRKQAKAMAHGGLRMRAVPSPRGNFMAVPPNGRTAGFAVLLYSKRQSVRLKRCGRVRLFTKYRLIPAGDMLCLFQQRFESRRI